MYLYGAETSMGKSLFGQDVIRRLAKQRVAKTCFERRNGVYTLPAWIIPPERLAEKDQARMKPVDIHGDAIMEPGFPRPGH